MAGLAHRIRYTIAGNCNQAYLKILLFFWFVFLRKHALLDEW
jgi:hypothetical protein